MSKRIVSALAVALLGGSLLAGCVVRPIGPPVYVGATVAVAPPADRVEYVGVAPVPGYVWFGGYWDWVGARHVWVAGHWGPGRAGYHWVPRRWVAVRGGWRVAPGRWVR